MRLAATKSNNARWETKGYRVKLIDLTSAQTKTSPCTERMSPPISTACNGCGLDFPSKNAVFRHLKDTSGACLSESDYQDFITYVVQQKREKVVILYGYYIPVNDDEHATIQNGEDVAQLLLDVMETASGIDAQKAAVTTKVNRSYGHASRGTNVTAQENGTSAVTEVLACKLPPLVGAAVDAWLDVVNAALQTKLLAENGNDTTSRGVQIVVMGRQFMPIGKFNAEMDVSRRRVEYLLPADFLIQQPAKNLPAFLDSLPSFEDGIRSRNFSKLDDESDDEATAAAAAFTTDSTSRDHSFVRRPSAEALALFSKLKKLMQGLTTQIVLLDSNDAAAVFEKKCHNEKRQKNKKFNDQKNEKESQPTKEEETKEGSSSALEETADKKDERADSAGDVRKPPVDSKSDRKAKKSKKANATKKGKKKKENILRRRRYHNFTPTVMAHEFLAYRRLDRFYHRATLRFGSNESALGGAAMGQNGSSNKRPFLALSMSGDMFLTGQACRIVGLFAALTSGVISEDIVDCLFDEHYPHLIPTPPAPIFAMYAGDVMYLSVEGKAKAILTPRKTGHYKNGWNDDATIQRVRDWQSILREKVAQTWLEGGVDQDGRLRSEKDWAETVLRPWAARATKQLEEYRIWKASNSAKVAAESEPTQTAANGQDATLSLPATGITKARLDTVPLRSLPLLETVDPSVPELYKKVLYYLRQADSGGLWPSTTPKRQLVMVSNINNEAGADGVASDGSKPLTSSLSIAHMKAQSNKAPRSSAYVFAEGEGGASGSFSVGAMPGEGCSMPKGNSLFPDLMKAAFELEIALCPDREPSSTIAVNRNAQFRPHTDSGAGAGQSTSLIVGLGTYSGGELMVEGEQMDIRYKPVEFDGWKQRHWTMPFSGERFSLVWFTPKGCEGVYGHELSK